jgi:hypothetical protein
MEALLAADSPQPLQEHYQLARAALGRGDAQKAERELKLQLQVAPNRFASHFFLIQNSEAYRRINGVDLATENLDYDILGKLPKAKAKQWN